MCRHRPPCPPADATDRDAAAVLVTHPEQGWSLLCNGVIAFYDGQDLLPASVQRAAPQPVACPRAA